MRALLRAGVMEDGAVRRSVTRHSAGRRHLAAAGQRLPAPARPGLADARPRGARPLRRRSRGDVPDRAGGRARPRGAQRRSWPSSGLEPKEAKTRIVHLREGGEGFDFLGFHHRWVRGRDPRSRHVAFLARWPSRQAMQHARDRVREFTARDRLLLAGRGGRAGPQPLPARLGGLLPLRKLGPPLRPDQPPRGRRGSRSSWPNATSAHPSYGAGSSSLFRVPEPPRPDHPQRNRRRATAQPALAGTPNAGGEQTSVSRVRENRMHGSMGGGRKPAPVGHAARRRRLPPTRHNLLRERRGDCGGGGRRLGWHAGRRRRDRVSVATGAAGRPCGRVQEAPPRRVRRTLGGGRGRSPRSAIEYGAVRRQAGNRAHLPGEQLPPRNAPYLDPEDREWVDAYLGSFSARRRRQAIRGS